MCKFIGKYLFWLKWYRRETHPVRIEQENTEQKIIPIHFSSKDPSPDLEYTWSVEYSNGIRIRFNSRTG